MQSESYHRERSGTQMRKTRELAAWPLFTGEDVPGDDASTVARCLIVPFIWEPGQPNPALTEAQSLASHLTAIGRTWLAARSGGAPEGRQSAADRGRTSGTARTQIGSQASLAPPLSAQQTAASAALPVNRAAQRRAINHSPKGRNRS